MNGANFFSGPLAKKINLICLLVAIASVLIFPFKKEIWYDETVSILCSKGINHDTPQMLARQDTLSSATLQAMNNFKAVHVATVVDNSNSFLYNISLHWFTGLAGNTLFTYTLFSKLSGIAALIALYLLAGLIFRQNIFTALAVLLFAIDTNFANLSHEVRTYTMTTLWVIIGGIYCYKYLYQQQLARYLFLASLFSVFAILSHFLSIYIVLCFVFFLVLYRHKSLFTAKAIISAVLPVLLLAAYFYASAKGISNMSRQNTTIQHKNAELGFSLSEVLFRSMHLCAMDFKIVYGAFLENKLVITCSFLGLVALFIAAFKSAKTKDERQVLIMLFVMGMSSTAFLAILSIKAHHYTSLYHRYHAFGVPYATLFTAFALYLITQYAGTGAVQKVGVICLVVLPAGMLYAISVIKAHPVQRYNHYAVASMIVHERVTKVEAPSWPDALLLHCFLPAGYKIDYVRNQNAPNFTLYSVQGTQVVPVVNIPN
jgi:hypothetical protein